ncbi:spore coat protein [Clostridium saccharobutylicum]|uniref:Spore coat protein n=1 Tax=Clostridium saccharobutylicum DSM 13864 TaxID=1345695 RepID=U5MUB2_CLOSA|nr:spore coat protein [Clostridium saccharobutylicum]AGX43251.1 spore coat protein [Clostridium saccharobutylicum DSM 13864]AQR90550.1 coat F domain protein [Clostridium saccharobutylicum]AQS00454.1 coat F domain protein [Clostridium saccharobutylicum]AQS10103.1 coat F domain protein [Clostridium saccharobutylicum]AQS14437.1 coat F domain protein [Clostridium saccharobutylicum]
MQITLSEKERMLLEDQKSHEQICIEKYSNYANQAQDTQLKQLCKNNEQIERQHLDTINQLLNGTVPQMNAQQNQNQNAGQNMNNTQIAGVCGASDKDICSDLLMTEKYVSGTYDTAIFEFKDTEVRDVLNHIQKEEQKHGESVFKYMESKGMYNVQ